ncbi:glycosyltransferase family 9 protein [Mumia sp. Pv 4-285]|uniref:glycosyltransferase family 9 protein n=1 Tax=Mumia qirimensis TaxID=3234852 RepID=UPI00351D38C3
MSSLPAASSRPRVLVLRALGLGDLLAAVPALRGLRRGLPRAEIVLVGPRDAGGLLRDAGLVDEVVPHQGLGPLPGGTHGADVAVNLHGRGPQSHRLLLSTRPRRLVAFADALTLSSGPPWRADEHERARWCRLIDEAYDVSADPDDTGLELALAEPIVRGAVVVHPGAAAGSRRWPAERWASVASTLAGTRPVVVTGSPRERPLAEQVAALAGLPPESVLAGRTDVRALAAVVASARLLLSSDTGVAHLAPAFGTPSVTLFGPTSPATWGPPRGRGHRVLWHGDEGPVPHRGDPHDDHLDPALAAITAEEVLALARTALRAGMPTADVGTAST